MGNIHIRTYMTDNKGSLLSKVTDIIKESLQSKEPNILSIYSFISENKGKMIRPKLFLETAMLFNKPLNGIYEIAASFELIHLASLLHDDIIDGASLRRGKTAVWKMWDINSAVLAGDLVWCKSFDLLFEYADKKILAIILNATTKMIEGELKDNLSAGKLNLDINEYLLSISNKTASLFEAICESCSILHDDFEASYNLKLFGKNFGMAFQIMDDVKDFISSEDKSGKPVFNDLKQRKTTLPLIIAIQKSNSDETNRLENSINNDELFEGYANEIIQKYNGVDLSKNFAKSYISKAAEAISPLKNKYNISDLINLVHQLAD